MRKNTQVNYLAHWSRVRKSQNEKQGELEEHKWIFLIWYLLWAPSPHSRELQPFCSPEAGSLSLQAAPPGKSAINSNMCLLIYINQVFLKTSHLAYARREGHLLSNVMRVLQSLGVLKELKKKKKSHLFSLFSNMVSYFLLETVESLADIFQEIWADTKLGKNQTVWLKLAYNLRWILTVPNALLKIHVIFFPYWSCMYWSCNKWGRAAPMLLCFPACSSTAGVASRLFVPSQHMTCGWPKPAEHSVETLAMLAFRADAFPAGSSPVKIRDLHGAYHYFQLMLLSFLSTEVESPGQSRPWTEQGIVLIQSWLYCLPRIPRFWSYMFKPQLSA